MYYDVFKAYNLNDIEFKWLLLMQKPRDSYYAAKVLGGHPTNTHARFRRLEKAGFLDRVHRGDAWTPSKWVLSEKGRQFLNTVVDEIIFTQQHANK